MGFCFMEKEEFRKKLRMIFSLGSDYGLYSQHTEHMVYKKAAHDRQEKAEILISQVVTDIYDKREN
jgi:hypothetical protein